MSKPAALLGYGGGKGDSGGRAPVETPDTLVSLSYAQILDLLCEGEIEGLVDDGTDADAPMKSVFLNGTPVRNPDGTYNFKSVGWAFVPGTQSQGVIPGFSDVESETAIGQEVKNATPIVRSVADPTVNAVVVTIEVPQLYAIDETSGDMVPADVEIAVDLQSNGGGYIQQNIGSLGRISGKCTHPYDRQIRLELTGSAPWDIRVRRVTADNGSETLQNSTTWKSITTVIDQKLSYPNSAMVGLSIPATQFSTPPSRSYLVRGLKVKVPSNYAPLTRTYVEPWDGTFKVAWTDNPAWCFYDLLTSSRYGLGKYLDTASVDKWGLYTIGKYCDELVSDGKGGQEPRFTCNLCLQSQEDAYRVINDFASIFRGMVYWASGAVQTSQDAPADSEYLFTPTNVVDGRFRYTSTAKRARHTVAIVSWNDPANHYKATREYVTDEEGLALHGYNPVEIGALGCTSQGQAQRLGRWILFTERMETEVVTFSTGLDGALRSPGAIITIQDPYRAGKRFGGRMVSTTTTEVQLDADVTLEEGVTYQLAAMLPDGTVEQRDVSSPAGTHRTLTVTAPFSQAPTQQGTWVLIASDLSPTYYRVLSVAEEEDGTYQIAALRHEPAKYAAVEQGLNLQPPVTSAIPSSAAPTNLVVGEALYRSRAGIKVRLQAGWDQNPNATHYAVRWRRDPGNWSNEEVVDAHFWEMLDVTPGLYWVQVQAIIAGMRTDVAKATYQVLGKTAPPADVSNFTAQLNPLSATLLWSGVPDLDIDHYELRLGADWATAAFIAGVSATSYEWAFPDTPDDYTILVKAVDTSGNYSANATPVTVTVSEGTIAGSKLADGAVSHKKLLQPPSDNLVPNGYSEAGNAALGLDPEGNGLVQDPANAYEGSWCRRLDDDGSGPPYYLYLTDFIPAKSGEQFYAECRMKGSAAFVDTGKLQLSFYDTNKAFLSSTNSTPASPSPTYAQHTLKGTVPAGACFVRLYWRQQDGANDNVGDSVFLDAVSLRKAITADLIVGNTIQTDGYTEEPGTGNATAGAKLDSQGTAFKAAGGGVKIGSHYLDDPFFRALNGMDGTFNDGYCFYRGNCDPGVNNGVPNINTLSIENLIPFLQTASPQLSILRYAFTFTPAGYSDNLDGMRWLDIGVYKHDDINGGDAVGVEVWKVPCPDRGYGDTSSLTFTANFIYPGGVLRAVRFTAASVYLLVRALNAYGYSAQRWYGPAAGNYSDLPPDDIPSGGPMPLPGGGSGPLGTCPAPEEPFLLANADLTGPGLVVPAGSIREGAWAWTQDEHTGEWGAHQVKSARPAMTMRGELTLEDGRVWRGAINHRWRVRGGFREMYRLGAHTLIAGAVPGRVRRIRPIGMGPVAHISMETGGTYVTRGLTGHNAKPR